MAEPFEIPNTLGVTATAAAGRSIQTLDELKMIRRSALEYPLQVIGQGSNIVPNSRVERFICTFQNVNMPYFF